MRLGLEFFVGACDEQCVASRVYAVSHDVVYGANWVVSQIEIRGSMRRFQGAPKSVLASGSGIFLAMISPLTDAKLLSCLSCE